MIDYLVFVPACFALNLAFGPNNLLALTHGAQRGAAFSIAAALGRLPVFAVMIAIVALGLGLILSTSAFIFTAIKLIGAAYLVWIGIRLWRSSYAMQRSQLPDAPKEFRTALRREALIASGNPKAMLIFAAFFPQFVQLEAYAQSYLILGALFLLLELLAITIYALIGHIAARTAANRLHWFQRASGIGMILFGSLMLFAKHPDVAP